VLGDLAEVPFVRAVSLRWEDVILESRIEALQVQVMHGPAPVPLDELTQLALEHPLREPVHEALCIALWRVGRQADALLAFDRLRRDLAEELGVDPSPTLNDLYLRLLRHDPSLPQPRGMALSMSVAASPVSGSVDASFSLTAPLSLDGLPRTPPLLLEAFESGNLPAPLTPLLHREADVTGVTGLLRENRLVTITGPGGVGKTRLALEVAAGLTPPGHGVWWVALDEVPHADGIADAVATALGAQGPDPLTALHRRLRRADLVLVLDNCEHLGQAPADFARDLLTACPLLRILATSQRDLAVVGEAVWRVRPFDTAEAVDFLRARLRQVDARLPVIDDEAMLNGMCERLDGLALALELAAARCATMPPTQILVDLDQDWDVLQDNRTGRAPRHEQHQNKSAPEIQFPEPISKR
jgi:hypothetical protein